MRFDWYQATVKRPVDDVVSSLRTMPGVIRIEREDGSLGHGYDTLFRALDCEERYIASLMAGPKQAPNLRATSDDAPAFAEWLRKEWPVHRVTRLDVAHDERGKFEVFERRIRRVAEKQRMKTGRKIVPDNPECGATYYLGSPSSSVQLRLYEKGKEMAARGDTSWPADLARLELQWRPEKAAKDKAAVLSPEACWGAARWSKLVLAACVRREVERIEPPRANGDLDETFDYFCAQWSRFLCRFGAREMRVEHGVPAGWVDKADAVDAALELVRERLMATDIERDGWDPDPA